MGGRFRRGDGERHRSGDRLAIPRQDAPHRHIAFLDQTRTAPLHVVGRIGKYHAQGSFGQLVDCGILSDGRVDGRGIKREQDACA